MHKTNAKSGMKGYFYNALRKWGPDAFDFEIIMECPLEQLNYWEKFYIKYYCSNIHDYGYNETEGGDGLSGVKRSKEAIEKTASKNRELWKTKEYRERQRLSHIGCGCGNKKGNTPWNKDIPMREETKEKLRKNAKENPNYGRNGSPCPEETKIDLHNRFKGHDFANTKERIWVNNGVDIRKRVLKEELETYLNNGFKTGKKY